MTDYNKVPEQISLAGITLFIYIAGMPLSIAKSGTASIYRYISLMSIALLILDYLMHTNRYYIYRRKVAPFTLYFTYTLISVVWSVNFQGALNIVFGMALIYIVYFFGTSRVLSQKEYKLISVAWIFATIVVIYLTTFNGIESGYERYTAALWGGTEDKNQIPGYYFMPLLIGLNSARKNKKLYVPVLVMLAGMLYSIMLTGSRGGLLSIFFTILIYFIFYADIGKNNSIVNRVLNLFLILTVVTIAMYFILPYISTTSISRFSVEAMLDDGGSGRLANWEKLLSIYSNSNVWRILFGFGANGTVMYLKVGYAHNQIIQVLFDGGIVGLILFLWFILKSFKYGLKKNRLAAYAFMGMFVLSMTITTYTAYKVYWNIIIMMDLLHNNESLYA